VIYWRTSKTIVDPLNLSEEIFSDNLLEETVKRLPRREAVIIRGVLLSNRTQASIARQLRVSSTRIHQLKAKAIKHMAEILKELGFSN